MLCAYLTIEVQHATLWLHVVLQVLCTHDLSDAPHIYECTIPSAFEIQIILDCAPR